MLFIYFIIISLPLYLVRFSVLGLRTNFLDILIMLFFCWWVARGRIWKKEKIKEIYERVGFLVVPTGLILVGVVSSAIIKSSDLATSLGVIKSWFILPILFFIAGADIVREDDQKIKVLRAWLLAGAIVSILSGIYYFKGDFSYDGRLSAFFSSPNQLAMFLAPVFIIGAWFSFKNISKYLTSVILIGIILFLTKSIGAIFAVLISLVAYLACSLKYSPSAFSSQKGKKLISKATIFAVLFLLLSAFCFLLFEKDLSERGSLASRFMVWESAGAILKDNPVLGIGPGMFQGKYLEYQQYFEPYLEWAVPHSHNVFLEFWLGGGIVALAGFLWLQIIFWKKIMQSSGNKTIMLCGALMAYFLIHGIIDATYWRNDLAIMFWLVVLLLLPLPKQKIPQ